MNIVTLTLNPAFDLHCDARDLRLYHENFVRLSSREAAGKGVNLSRALAGWGTASRCVVLAGEDNAREFFQALERDGLSCQGVLVPGRIRENLTLHEKGKEETRVSFPGFFAPVSCLAQVEQAVGEVNGDTVIVFTGSAPEGLDAAAVRGLLENLRAQGAKLVIDSRLFSLSELLALRPYLIKPNAPEAASYGGAPLKSVEEAADFACELHARGVDNAMVSLGELGAVLCCREGCYHASAPLVEAVSTVGAGDSTLAGFLSAVGEGLSPDQALKRAVAFGSAACRTKGSRPPRREDVLGLLDEGKLRTLR